MEQYSTHWLGILVLSRRAEKAIKTGANCTPKKETDSYNVPRKYRTGWWIIGKVEEKKIVYYSRV